MDMGKPKGEVGSVCKPSPREKKEEGETEWDGRTKSWLSQFGWERGGEPDVRQGGMVCKFVLSQWSEVTVSSHFRNDWAQILCFPRMAMVDLMGSIQCSA